jgi:5-methylcytosine-specific restriction endonuclease McrA
VATEHRKAWRKKYEAINKERLQVSKREQQRRRRAVKKQIKIQNLIQSGAIYIPRKTSKIIYKNCEHCGILYTTSRLNKRFCTTRCQKQNENVRPYSKRIRRHRKLIIERYRQPISKHFKKDIIQIYEARPEGTQVDHIIPINGENVSGLHVPWNLQYLTPEENNAKSNKTLT